MGSEELLPCPFCGGEAEIHPKRDGSKKGLSVECMNGRCDMAPHADSFPNTTEAIAAWNTRAQQQPVEGWQDISSKDAYDIVWGIIHALQKDSRGAADIAHKVLTALRKDVILPPTNGARNDD